MQGNSGFVLDTDCQSATKHHYATLGEEYATSISVSKGTLCLGRAHDILAVVDADESAFAVFVVVVDRETVEALRAALRADLLVDVRFVSAHINAGDLGVEALNAGVGVGCECPELEERSESGKLG